ncbi:Glycerol-3-phosphate regulon repressor [Grimontia celer]|uniref:Glycerol-3-phosphate regulon repressor n=1 Tax=Grimontia celer TaxID=1796497 RepID=A0A128EUV1_9GAMM|nr:DeoR/GlpR family DNA-binding transcription regulator [Grimontia celer]CZF77924.1 Glycerol-3-phosphate regulon repressor [Grimontia celer]
MTPRQRQILDYLKANGNVQIEELAEMFSITTQTIRRDVNCLSEQGLARRVHGGVSLPAILTNTTYQFRFQLESEIKQILAKKVASHIPEGSTVFLGIGTSMAYIAQCLAQYEKLRIVTNNLQVEKVLQGNYNVDVFLAGGLVRSQHQDVVGQSVLRFFEDFEADIGIVGCGSVTASHFAMEHEPIEAEISRSIVANSRESWLLADASKWGRFASSKVASLSDFSKVYTNQDSLPSDINVCGVK